MLSIRNSWTALVAVAMLALVGCSKEKPADPAGDTWTTKGNDLQMKLDDVKKGHEALYTQLNTMAAAASTDSAVTTERAAIEKTLNDDATKLGQIETMLNEHTTRREKLKADGDDDAYKAAWTAEESKYNEAMTSLDEMQKRNSELKSRVDNLATLATNPAGGKDSNDLTRMPSMPEMKDSSAGATPGSRSGNIDTGSTVKK